MLKFVKIIYNMSVKKHVLIIGGGFGGIKCALTLANDPHFKITLISKSNRLVYYPLLYEKITSLKKVSATIPFTDIFDNKDITIIQDEVISIDKINKTISTLTNKKYAYDYLVLSLGTVSNDFNIPGVKEYAFDIKNWIESQKLREQIHHQISTQHHLDKNYFIIGGGPTGLEIAGNLSSYIKEIAANHGILSKKVNITIVEAAPRLLPNLPKDASKIILNRLKKLDIHVKLNSKLEEVKKESIIISGKEYPSHIVIWSGGSKNNPFFQENNFTLTSRSKVSVDAYLQTERNIYVIGDNANTPYSGMAQTALIDGQFVAQNLIRLEHNLELKSYKVKKPITIIPIGPYWAILIWKKIRIYGLLAWIFRGIADVVGYHDLENWSKLSKQLVYKKELDEDCPICQIAEDAKGF